jgi:hypothetical protein
VAFWEKDKNKQKLGQQDFLSVAFWETDKYKKLLVQQDC